MGFSKTMRARLTTDPMSIDQSVLIEPLAARELEVLKLLSDGCSNKCLV
jgi:ATP/maltotriose-dependent transcriptional regulator MalT